MTFKNKKAIDTLSRFLAAGIWDGNVIISIIENPCGRGHSRAALAPREEKSERTLRSNSESLEAEIFLLFTFEDGADVLPDRDAAAVVELTQGQLHVEERDPTEECHQEVGQQEGTWAQSQGVRGRVCVCVCDNSKNKGLIVQLPGRRLIKQGGKKTESVSTKKKKKQN